MPPKFISNIDHALSKLSGGQSIIQGQQNIGAPAGPTGPSRTLQGVAPGRILAPSQTVYNKTNVPGFATRLAQSQTIFTQPSFYSPLHTPQNWQIPSKRREIMQWLYLLSSQVLTENYTYKSANDIFFEPCERIVDIDTGEEVFELEQCEKIVASSGILRKPCRIAFRECTEKGAISFKVWGYWRTLDVTDDHMQIWLDGNLYRKKKNLQQNEDYRRKMGKSQGTKRHQCHNISTFIKKGPASDVSLDDFLLHPVPPVGTRKFSPDEAWVIGCCAADGCIYGNSVRFTIDGRENIKSDIEKVLSSKFESKISSRQHGDGNGWRISVTTKVARTFFEDFIEGKRTNKKLSLSIFDLDKQSRLNFLAGYLDGDGCYNKRFKRLVATNYSKDMADQLYALFLSVGIRCSITKQRVPENAYPTNSKWRYLLRIPSSDVLKIAPFMRSQKVPCNFSPKIGRDLRFFYEEDGHNFLAQPIRSIKKYKYSGLGFDLQVDPEGALVANGFVSSNCRFFYENEPKVAAAIDFYSDFGMNGFELQCDDPKILRLYQGLNKKLKLENYWCKMISRERHMIGDVFPFLEIECEQCNGSMVDMDGNKCNHPHGSFRRLVILNPDWVDVQTNIMAEDPVITLLPDDELKRIVWHKQPRAIYDRIPNHIKSLIMSGRPIPLDNGAVSHIKFNPYPYGVYGNSMIRRLFKVLAYKDKLMSAQWIVSERLILPVRIVKVGNDERPAGPAEIADVQQQLAQVANDPNLTLVTHHAFDYEWIGTSGKVLQLSNEYELINKEILQGLMLNEALLSGDMPGYSAAAIGAEAIIRRIESWRKELSEWIEESIYKPVAQMKGLIDEEATKEYGDVLGEPIWIYPTIKWNDLHLRDKTSHDQILLQLQERGLVSAQTTLEKLEYDYDQEVERIRYETAAQSAGMMGQGADGGAGGMGGMGGMDAGGMGAPPPPGGAGGLEGGMDAGPDMGGGMGGPGMGGPGMGAPMGGGPGAAAASGPPVGTTGKIMPRGKEKKLNKPEEEEVQPSNIPLTSLEQKLYKSLVGMKLPFPVYAQYPLGPYRTDFSIPALKLAIESDGQQWHSSPEAVAHDQKRDSELAFYGWTVVRFSERELKDRLNDVEYTIATVVNDLWRGALGKQEKMREMQEASMDGQKHIKLALVEDLHSKALATKENIVKVQSQSRKMTGLIVESLVNAFRDKNLMPSGRWQGYLTFDASNYPRYKLELLDGEADQGAGDSLGGDLRR